MSKTRATRRLLEHLNQMKYKITSVNEEGFSSSSLTITSSLMRDPAIPTNTNKVKFHHHKRKKWTFLNIRLNVSASQKITTTIVAT